MAKRRKADALFPDYRTKGWNQAKWTRPVIGCSSVLLFLVVLGVASAVAKPLPSNTQAGVMVMAVIGVAIGIGSIRGLLWRVAVRPKLGADPEDADSPSRPRRKFRSVMSLSAAEFELEIAFVLEGLYPVRAEVVGGSGDGGIDLMIYDRTTNQLRAIVQAKRYNPDKVINPTYIRELAYNRRRLGCERAFLITTARFGNGALEVAAKEHIKLVTGQQFEVMRRKVYLKRDDKEDNQLALGARPEEVPVSSVHQVAEEMKRKRTALEAWRGVHTPPIREDSRSPLSRYDNIDN